MSDSPKPRLGTASALVLLTILAGGDARVVAQAPAIWQFESVAQGNLIPGCVTGMTLAGFEFDPDGRPVLAWREENGCGPKPRIHWTRREAGQWNSTEFLSPRRYGGGGEGDYAHQLGLSKSDGTPFFIYADVGDNNSINTYQTDLGTHPKGDLLPAVEHLVGPQSCAGVNYSLAFGPSDATPQWSTGLAGCSGGGPVRLNGTSLTDLNGAIIQAYNPRSSLAIGADGTRHLLWINDRNVFYTRWLAGTSAPDTTIQLFTDNAINRGEGKIVVDGAGTLHALVRGPDISTDFDFGAIVYLSSADDGKTWSSWEYVDPHDNPAVQNPWNNNTDMSLAVDADGVPAVTFWRWNSELYYARRDGPGGTWTQQLIASVPFTNPTRTNQLRFDPNGEPVIAFYDPLINRIRLARPVPAGVVVPVDVAVTATATPGVLPAGAAITYTLTVTNKGTTNLKHIVLANTLPGGTTLVSASPAAGGDGLWAFALNSGASATVMLSATAPFAEGSFLDVASVSTDAADEHPEDNVATASARVMSEQCFAPHTASAGLTGWWRGDGSGANSVAGQPAATTAGGVKYEPAVVGNGFKFDGTSGAAYVYHDNDNFYYPMDGSFTVQAYIQTTSPGGIIASRYECTGNCKPTAWFFSLDGSGHLSAWLRDRDGPDITFHGTRAVNDGAFHHVALVLDRSTAQAHLYVDGEVDASSPFTLGSISDANGPYTPVVIGAYVNHLGATVAFFSGVIDELGIYNRALAKSEIAQLSSVPSLPACGDVVVPATTTTTLRSDTNPSASGQAVTFTATVATVGAVAVTPAGEVAFVYVPTNTTLATMALAGGTASFETSGLPEGTFDVQAIFTGNASFAGSTATLTQVVATAAETPIRNGVPESRSQFNGVGMILPSATHGACTATLISPFIVLTAAHCLRDESPDPVFEFSLGEGRTARLTEIRVHPVFNGPDGINLAFDVALASLDRAVAASWTDIIPATLRANPPAPVVEATAIGFGETSAGAGSGRRTSGTLLVTGYLAGEDQNFNTLPDAFLEANPGIANQMFCSPAGAGGPLFFEDQIVGVASFRFVATCAEAGPGYYVTFGHVADWIQATAHALEIPPNPRVEFTAPATTSFNAYIGREVSFDVTATVLDAPLYTASITSAPVLPRSTLTQVTTGSTSTSRFRWTPFPRFEADGVTPITSEVVCFQGAGVRAGADSIPSVAQLCVTISIQPAQLMTLSGTLRGFRPAHPDGHRLDGDQGVVIVASELGVDRKPRFSPGGPLTTIESESTFNEWWNDGPRTVTSAYDVVLSNGSQTDPRVYEFESTAFQPGHKYFSFEGHARIPYVPGDSLRFGSADDLWVFINGHLAIDLGGVHPPASAHVDLDARAAELRLAAGEPFTIDVFYAHRGLHDAALALRLPPGLESCVPSGAQRRLRKPLASPLTLTVGESISGIVDVYDICGFPMAATVDDVAVTLTRAGVPPVNGLLSPEADGSVSFLVPLLTAGEWRLNVTYRGEHIQGSPFTVITENRPPVLVNPGDQLSIAGDTILPLALAASDQDGDPLTYSASNLPPGLSVTPSTGVIAGTLLPTSAGAYDVTVSAFDGALSDSKSFTWTVSTCNPLALPDAAATPQNTPVDIQVLDNDIVPTACIAFGLDLSAVSQPQHGTVVFDGKLRKVTYTPATDFVGTDTFDYTITNSVGGTATAAVTVTVMPVTISIGDVTAAESNSGTTPFAFAVTLSNPSAQTITVHYTTADGTAAIGDDDYAVASGTLAFAPGQTSQTVVVNIAGDTKFEPAETFGVTLSSPAHATVMAGTGTGTILNDDSAPTISIGNVTEPEGNSGTTAFGFAVTLSNPSAQIVTVNYATANGTATTRHGDYTPTSGTLTFASGQASQTVVVNVTGDTTFEPDQTFRVNLSAATNATIIVATGTGTIQNDDNHPPVAVDDTAVTNEDTAVTIRVLANDSDPDARKLVVESVTSATHGVASINASRRNVRYVPSANFNGSDSFTYTVTDGQGGSATATVHVTVTPVNDRPAADALTFTTAEDTPITITLSGTDIDDDPLTIQFGNPPHGTIAGTAPNVVYTPDANFVGSDSFTFTVNDGALTSVAARVTITITPVNDAPFFNPIADRTVPEDAGLRTVTINGVTAGAPNESAQPVTVIATSSNLAVLPNPIITGSGATRTLSFQSAPNKNGTALITVVADDGQSESHVFSRTFTVTVTPVNDRPVANAMTSSGFEDNQLGIVLTASDVESDPLTFILKTNPAHGSLAGIPPNLVYTPIANYFGPDSFTFTVNDGQRASTAATVTISLAPVNDRPVAVAQNDMTPAGTPVSFTLSASDLDSPSLTYAIVSGPAHGTLSGTLPQIVYTPAADYIGADSFTFTARDTQLTSVPATVSVSVGVRLRYSTDITVDLGDGVIVGGDQVVEDTGVGPVTPVLSMPAHIDGYQLRADGVHLLSFDTTVSLPGGVTAGPADVVTWDGVRATVAFNAAARGIPNGANVRSVGLTGTSLLLSFDTTVQLSSALTAGPRDIVRVTGNGFQSFFAGAAAGIADGLGIAGSHFLEASNVLLLAFDGAGVIGGVNFTKTDVLEFDRATNTWRMFWAGATSRPGLANAGIAGLWVTPATAPLITTAPLHDE